MKRFTGRNSDGTAYIINKFTYELQDLIDKLAYYEDLDDKHLIGVDLNDENTYPCDICNVGWATITTEKYRSCRDSCDKLKHYYSKYV